MLKNWLALMVGNSRLHWAWFQATELKLVWDTPHFPESVIATLIDHRLGWGNAGRALTAAGIDLPPDLVHQLAAIPSGLPLWCASVVPAQTRLWQQSAQVQIITLNQIPLAGVYPTLGIDRALALWGAIAVYGAPCLVIDAGTALTLTGADAAGQLIGGAILPGLQLQFRSLSEHTAALPALSSQDLQPLPRWATNTIEAIQSGVIYTLLAGLRDFINAWQQEFPNSHILLTGGDATYLKQGLGESQAGLLHASIDPVSNPNLPIDLDRQLIFYGIRRVWQASQTQEERSEE